MSTIALPASFVPTNCTIEPFENELVNSAPFGGSEEVIDLMQHRWIARIQIGEKAYDEAQALEAFVAQMRRRINVAQLYHFARPAPRGTARGSIVLSGAVSQGATTLPITGASPLSGTLVAGDMLGVAGLLFMVAADMTCSGGAGNVPITNPTRKALLAGAAVTWDKPSAPFRLASTSGVNYVAEQSSPTSLEFMEWIS